MRATPISAPPSASVVDDGAEDGAMQPTSFPIVAEARMAERLLEVERERMARAVATARPRGGPKPQATSSRMRSLLARVSTVALAGCLLLAATAVGQTETHPAGRVVAVPTHVLARTSTIAHAGYFLFGGTVAEETAVAAAARPASSPIRATTASTSAGDLPSSPCSVPTFGWVYPPTAWLLDASLLRAPILLPVCPLP